MMRALGWVSMVLGTLLTGLAVFQTPVVVIPLLIGSGLMVAGILMLVPDDVLGDHPEEPRGEDPVRWRPG